MKKLLFLSILFASSFAAASSEESKVYILAARWNFKAGGTTYSKYITQEEAACLKLKYNTECGFHASASEFFYVSVLSHDLTEKKRVKKIINFKAGQFKARIQAGNKLPLPITFYSLAYKEIPPKLWSAKLHS